MPQLIPVFAYYGAQAIGAGALGAAFAGAAAAVVVGSVQQSRAARAARDAFNTSLKDRYVLTSLADAPRSRIYGRARNVDGVLYKATHGSDNRYYSLIVAICDAPTAIDAVETVYFNDVPLTLDGSGYVQTAPWGVTVRTATSQNITSFSAGAGSVTLSNTPVTGTVKGSYVTGSGVVNETTHEISVSMAGLVASVSGVPDGVSLVQVSYQYDAVQSFARVRTYLGGSAQDLHSTFADLPDITSTDKFAGIALARLDFEYNQDAFPAGLPQVTFTVRGTKCFDPRTSTTAWTQNPAIIARDWSLYTYGGNISSGAYNDTIGNASANAADVDATFTTGGTPVVMDTYQCGLVCRLDASPQQWLEAMVESMAGRWGWVGGKLCVQAGAYRSPVATITEDWVTDAGEITVAKDIPVADMVNGYRPTIANRDNNHVAEPMPELAPAAYVSADGQKLVREVVFEGVTSRQHALHVAGVMLRDSRQGLQVELPCNYRAFALELFDVVNVTLPFFGWSAKTFEVLGWSHSLPGGVRLRLKEIAASIYTPDASFTGLENEDNTNLPDPSVVPQLTGFAVANDNVTWQDGGNVARVKATWTTVPDVNVQQSGWVEIQFLRLGLSSGDPAYNQWASELVRGDRTAAYITAVKPGGAYLFVARAINTMGVRGKWSDQKLLVITAAQNTGGAPALTLVAHGSGASGINIAGDRVTKAAGASAWDAGVYSKAPIVGGCEVSFRSVASAVMVALNTDPTTDANYTGLDYAVYIENSSNAQIYESGSLVVTTISSAYGDTWTIRYTGASVEYRRNGILVRVVKAAIAKTFYLDSSFYGPGSSAAEQIKFTPIAAKAVEYRASSYGSSASLPGSFLTGLRHVDADNYNEISIVRSYNMARISVATGLVTFTQTYDVAGNGAVTSGRNAATLASDLDATGDDSYVVVIGHDEPQGNRLASGLDAAMYRCGASPRVFGAGGFKYRAAYILIGRGNIGTGKGYEAYRGDADSDTNAYLQVAFQITQAGLLLVDGQPFAGLLDGVVGTPALAPDARGVRRVITPSSSVTVSKVTHVPDGYSFKDVLAADSQFTAAYNGKAVVTFEGNVSMSANAQTTEFVIGNTDATYTGVGIKQTGANPFGSTYRFSVSTTRTFDLVANSTYTFKCVASKANSSETISFDEMQMVVEITYTG